MKEPPFSVIVMDERKLAQGAVLSKREGIARGIDCACPSKRGEMAKRWSRQEDRAWRGQ